MRIHIITGHFTPQLHPRAFRASELAIELAKRGHTVEVSNLTIVEGFDYSKFTSETGVEVHNLGYYVIKAEDALERINNSWVSRTYKFLKEYLLAGKLLFMAKRIADELDIKDDTDAIISLSTPFVDILGVSYYIRKRAKNFVAIADSGDPFYYSKQRKHAFWFKWIEMRSYKDYNFLTIPTENAISAYSPLIERSKIKIIPQGFRMDNLDLYKGDFEGPVRIAYAGVFYWDIRNPEFLFKCLNESEYDYELYLFMRNRDALVDDLLSKYPKLSSRVIVKSLPHDELLYELSRMHFLINIENTVNTQLPSKIIDYGMSGRPVLSCNKGNFNAEKLDRFMNGIYTGALEVDVQRYNIVNIANQFEDLIYEAINK